MSQRFRLFYCYFIPYFTNMCSFSEKTPYLYWLGKNQLYKYKGVDILNTQNRLHDIVMASPNLQREIMGTMLTAHFKKRDPVICSGLERLRDDPYHDILQMFYGRHKLLQAIAIAKHADRSTVVRHKKDLLLRLFHICYGSC